MNNKLYSFFILLLFNGCFYFGGNWDKEIYEKPSTQWNSRECLTVISASMSHNLNDNRTCVKVIATPYYPSVIMAIYKNGHELRFNEDQFRNDVDGLLKDNVGMYYDWNSFKLFDSRGNYYKDKTQIDSLMFLITFQNRAYGSAMSAARVAGMGGVTAVYPLVAPDQVYIPDISNLEDKIFLVNDNDVFIKPKYVWGKRRSYLTMDETLLAMFYLRNGTKHFLDKSNSMHLAIKGFGSDIDLEFPLAYMR